MICCGACANAEGVETIEAAGEPGVDSVTRNNSSPKATTLSRGLSQKCLASDDAPEPAAKDSLKRHKSRELGTLSADLAGAAAAGGLRVRTVAGTLVVSMTRQEAEADGADVRLLRAKVLEVVGRTNQVKLFDGSTELKDEDGLAALAAGAEPSELLLVTSQVPRLDPDKPPIEQLDVLKGMIQSFSAEYQLDGATHIRKLLSSEADPPIQQFVDLGIVPRLISLSAGQDGATAPVQFEALWGLTNIASGSTEQTQVVVDAGALPVFVDLLRGEDCPRDVFEQAAWALGNVAGDSVDLRDQVTAAGALTPLLARLGSAEIPEGELSLTRNATWALSNLCRGKPSPPLEVMVPVAPVLGRLIQHEDHEVLADACWAASYLSDGDNDRIAVVIEAGLCPRLIELLKHQQNSVLTPALRAVGNIATGEEEQTQILLDGNVLPDLLGLMSHAKRSIRKEACWTLSNILAGSQQQIQASLDAGAMPALLQRLGTDDVEVKKEAAWCVANASSGGTSHQISQLVAGGCVEGMADMLSGHHESRVQAVVLEFFENILAQTDPSPPESAEIVFTHAGRVRDALSEALLEELRGHTSEEVADKAQAILERLHPESEGGGEAAEEGA